MRILKRPVSFPVVADNARGDKIFPCILSQIRLRDDMVHGQRCVMAAAILAAMTIPAKDVFPRKDDLLIRHVNVDAQANDAGGRH